MSQLKAKSIIVIKSDSEPFVHQRPFSRQNVTFQIYWRDLQCGVLQLQLLLFFLLLDFSAQLEFFHFNLLKEFDLGPETRIELSCTPKRLQKGTFRVKAFQKGTVLEEKGD